LAECESFFTAGSAPVTPGEACSDEAPRPVQPPLAAACPRHEPPREVLNQPPTSKQTGVPSARLEEEGPGVWSLRPAPRGTVRDLISRNTPLEAPAGLREAVDASRRQTRGARPDHRAAGQRGGASATWRSLRRPQAALTPRAKQAPDARSAILRDPVPAEGWDGREMTSKNPREDRAPSRGNTQRTQRTRPAEQNPEIAPSLDGER
jgi:hypothetical protein